MIGGGGKPRNFISCRGSCMNSVGVGVVAAPQILLRGCCLNEPLFGVFYTQELSNVLLCTFACDFATCICSI